MTASAAATVAVALGMDDTPDRGRLTMTDISRIRERVGRLDAHFFALGGGPLVDVSTAYIERLHAALDGCAYGDRVGQALHAEISGLCALAGWAAHDSGNPAVAARMHTASLHSALLAGDPSATARAWSNLALQARIEGRHREAVRIARTALDSRPARQDPRIGALLHSRLAIGQAYTRDHAGAARSLLAAERAFDRARTGDHVPPWLTFLTEAEVSGLAALAHQAMGQHTHAEAAYHQTLTLLPPQMRRQRALYRVQLAELHLKRHDRDAAAATIAALDTTLDSRRFTSRLDAVQRALTA
ncbi:hypothetical protein ACWCQL_30125 [Streptomyces sp. NPDC002073]